MPPIIIDVGIIVLVLGMTYALISEGAWGAALMFFNSVFAGLITFNFYEPLAGLIGDNVGFLSGYADALSILAVFTVSLLLLRLTTENVAPAMVRLPTPLYHLGRIVFGVGGACVTMSIIMLAFHASPVHKKVLGVVDYKYAPPFGLGFDRAWLAFMQYSSGATFPDYSSERVDRNYGNARVFDPEARWLLVHQDARPHGEGNVLETDAAGAAEGGAEGGGPEGGGPDMGGASAPMPGRPGPGIPGGTAGAAAGLAPTNP